MTLIMTPNPPAPAAPDKFVLAIHASLRGKKCLRSGEVREAFRCWGLPSSRKYLRKLIGAGVLKPLKALTDGEQARYSSERIAEIIRDACQQPQT